MSIAAAIQQLEADFLGRLCFAARDLRSGRTFLWHGDAKSPTASVIKLPILVHTLLLAREGTLSMDEPVELRDEDKKPGSGILKDLSAGLRLSLRDACMLMIALSDNTATNLVLDRVSIEGVNRRMEELGCRQTRLFRKVFSEGPPVSRENVRYGLGVTTPRDMLRLLTRIFRGQIGDAALCREVRRYLAAQHYRDGIPRYLPSGWSYEGKGGAVDAARNDVGFVLGPEGEALALAVFCHGMPKPLWTPDNPGLVLIARVAATIVSSFASPSSSGDM